MLKKLLIQFAIKILLGALKGAGEALKEEIGTKLREVPNDVLEKGMID